MTPDPSQVPLAVWLTGGPMVEQLLDTMLLGFGVLVALVSALLVATGLRRA